MRARARMYVEFTGQEVKVMMRALDRTRGGLEALVEAGIVAEDDARIVTAMRGGNFRDVGLNTRDRIERAWRVLVVQSESYQMDLEMPFGHWFKTADGSPATPGTGAPAPLIENADRAWEVLKGARHEQIDEIIGVLAILQTAIAAIKAAEAVWSPHEAEAPEAEREEFAELDALRAERKRGIAKEVAQAPGEHN